MAENKDPKAYVTVKLEGIVIDKESPDKNKDEWNCLSEVDVQSSGKARTITDVWGRFNIVEVVEVAKGVPTVYTVELFSKKLNRGNTISMHLVDDNIYKYNSYIVQL
jgi:hypothetical protein